MGLLDDAIREHLELKRRHGASDEEIERAEQEALAPARREPAAELEEPLAAEPTAVESVPPPVDEPVYADEYAAEPAPADMDEEPPPAAGSVVDEPMPDDATRIREVVSARSGRRPARGAHRAGRRARAHRGARARHAEAAR